MSSGDGESVHVQGLTIADAASQLGLSQKTVRRWIKAGRLPATMVDGPYGPRYLVSTHAVQTAQQVVDVVKVERPNDPQALALAVSRAIRESQAELMNEIIALRQEVQELRGLLDAPQSPESHDSAEHEPHDPGYVYREPEPAKKPWWKVWRRG
jgi:excisionase family DNA binding protein